jgi:hypothetical protein
MFKELNSLSIGKQTQAFRDGDVFRLLAKLNPSLLTALRLCDRGPVPEEPRVRAFQMSADVTYRIGEPK